MILKLKREKEKADIDIHRAIYKANRRERTQ